MGTTRATFKKTQITPITTVCFNDDLLTEILRRLPAKSILRFKSVSKHWLLLLSHRHFTLLYDNRLISPGFFVGKIYVPFDDEKPSPCPFRSLGFYLDSRGIRILQSCNGLLLCCSKKLYKSTCKYYVFNPTTNQFAVIPSVIDGQGVHIFINCMGLAFHPTDCVHFKIVCIYQTNEYSNSNGMLYRIQVYSSETGEWTISHETFSVNYFMSFYRGVYWNGAVYLLTLRKVLFYFKLDPEQLKNLPLPKQKGYCRYFGESRGHLHLVKIAYGENRLGLNVYEMSSDHSGWFVKYRVELDELVAAYPEMVSEYHIHDQFEVIDLVRGDEEKNTFMLVRISKKIIRYDVVDKSFKLISDLSGTMDCEGKVYRYIECIGSF